MSDRDALSRAFLDQAGWGAARRAPLAGDASARRYERLTLGGAQAVLMDAPPGAAEDVAPFIRVAGHLRALGLSAPAVLAEDRRHGFLLLADLGDDLFARLIAQHPGMEAPLYHEAVNVLLTLQARPPLPGLPDATDRDWAEAAALVLDGYAFGVTGARSDAGPFVDSLANAMAAHASGPRVMILRDYHAENLLWLPGRDGVARVGLLDFQTAQMGQPGYDLVSLCQDARRDVSPEVERACVRQFVARTGTPDEEFARAYAVLGAQRALRIIGVFARLAMRDGKPGYLPLIPRVWAQLQRNLAHPALADLARLCAALLPPPEPAALARIRARCPAP